jgi:hypothetical protein
LQQLWCCSLHHDIKGYIGGTDDFMRAVVLTSLRRSSQMRVLPSAGLAMLLISIQPLTWLSPGLQLRTKAINNNLTDTASATASDRATETTVERVRCVFSCELVWCVMHSYFSFPYVSGLRQHVMSMNRQQNTLASWHERTHHNTAGTGPSKRPGTPISFEILSVRSCLSSACATCLVVFSPDHIATEISATTQAH